MDTGTGERYSIIGLGTDYPDFLVPRKLPYHSTYSTVHTLPVSLFLINLFLVQCYVTYGVDTSSLKRKMTELPTRKNKFKAPFSYLNMLVILLILGP
jgi:hypothetical protein